MVVNLETVTDFSPNYKVELWSPLTWISFSGKSDSYKITLQKKKRQGIHDSYEDKMRSG